MRCRPTRYGRWSRCRSGPAKKQIPGRTASLRSLPTCRRTAPTRSSGSPCAARRWSLAKAQFDLIPADALGQVSDYSSPIVAASAIRLVLAAPPCRPRQPARQRGDLERARPTTSAVLRRCPARRRTSRCRPSPTGSASTSPCTAMGIRMDFGLISDRDLVPDLWHLVDLHIAEIERLFDATGATRAAPQEPPAIRHGGDGVAPIEAPARVTQPRRQPKRTPPETPPAHWQDAAASQSPPSGQRSRRPRPPRRQGRRQRVAVTTSPPCASGRRPTRWLCRRAGGSRRQSSNGTRLRAVDSQRSVSPVARRVELSRRAGWRKPPVRSWWPARRGGGTRHASTPTAHVPRPSPRSSGPSSAAT